MKIWKNTQTLDSFVPQLANCSEAAEAEVAVIGGKEIILGDLPRLKGIFKCGIGRDNVPEAECRERGISVCFPSKETTGVIFEETANFAVHLILRMLYSNIGEVDGWVKEARKYLGAKRVLLIGQGNIGRRVHQKINRLVKVDTFDIVSNEERELQPMLERADVVSLHVPLVEGSRGFIDGEKMAAMKDGASIVNTARGPIVDEGALLREVERGRLNAAFDVFWEEPYTGPLRAFHPERFLMSPHVASTCTEFLLGLASDLNDFLVNLEQD